MNNQEPQEFSPLEPNYFRHFRKRPDGWITWALENQATLTVVAQGAEATYPEARAALEKAVEKDLRRIAQSFRL